MEIQLPEKFSPEYLKDFQEALEESQYEDKVHVDFSTLKYSYPMSMLVAGSYLRRWITIRREAGLETTRGGISNSNNSHGYLKHLGFFNYVGMKDVGNRVGEASGNTRYLPIREIKLSDLEESIKETGEKLVNAIIFTSDGMANILSNRGSHAETKRAYSYAIREIIRNTFEHSGAESCFICGQRWYNGSSEIAIIDEGVGISKTLLDVYDINEEDALSQAIKPGVSRTHKMSDDENIFQNSGYGLFALSQLGSSFGWFRLGSGAQSLTHENQEETTEQLAYDGTFVGLHLNESPKDFAGVLKDIISVGEEEAETEGRLSAASELSKQG